MSPSLESGTQSLWSFGAARVQIPLPAPNLRVKAATLQGETELPPIDYDLKDGFDVHDYKRRMELAVIKLKENKRVDVHNRVKIFRFLDFICVCVP
jgi:hypothetical protein